MRKQRFIVTAQHGEAASVFYVVDRTGDQPNIVAGFRNDRRTAQGYADAANILEIEKSLTECPECGKPRPNDDHMRAGMKFGPCSYGGAA